VLFSEVPLEDPSEPESNEYNLNSQLKRPAAQEPPPEQHTRCVHQRQRPATKPVRNAQVAQSERTAGDESRQRPENEMPGGAARAPRRTTVAIWKNDVFNRTKGVDTRGVIKEPNLRVRETTVD
jgi:hypothetical protein